MRKFVTVAMAVTSLVVITSATTLSSKATLDDPQMAGRCAPYPECTLGIIETETSKTVNDQAAAKEQRQGKAKQS